MGRFTRRNQCGKTGAMTIVDKNEVNRYLEADKESRRAHKEYGYNVSCPHCGENLYVKTYEEYCKLTDRHALSGCPFCYGKPLAGVKVRDINGDIFTYKGAEILRLNYAIIFSD